MYPGRLIECHHVPRQANRLLMGLQVFSHPDICWKQLVKLSTVMCRTNDTAKLNLNLALALVGIQFIF